MVDYLIVGNDEVRLDMLKTLCSTKDIAFINKASISSTKLHESVDDYIILQ